MTRYYRLLICGMLSLFLLVVPSAAFASVTGSSPSYTVSSDEFIAESAVGSAGTVTLKTSAGLTKWTMPSDIVGSFDRITIRVGRVLSATNYLTVTLGDGYTIIINNNDYVSSGYATIQQEQLAGHAARGVSIKYTHDGDYAVKVYLASFETVGSTPGATPTPSATVGPTSVPSATPHPSSPTSSPNPSASATASPTENPDPDPDPTDPGGDTGETCLCPELCEIMPGILSGFGDQLNGISNALAPLHNDLAIVQDQLFGVRDDLNNLNNQAQQINSNTAPLHNDLNDIKDLNRELIRQLTPNQEYFAPNPVVVPDYYKPPDVAAQSFKDNNTYFSDSGDAATPGAMPVAPEPKNWMFEGKQINQNAEIVPAPKQSQSPAMTSAPNMEREPIMTAAPDMERDPSMTVSPDMQIDPIMTASPQQTKGPDFQMGEKMEMDMTEYPVRWDSSDFP